MAIREKPHNWKERGYKKPVGYEVTFRVNGRKRGKTCRTKREAQDYEAAVRADKARGQFVDPAKGRIRFGHVADNWLRSKHHTKSKTLQGYESILRNHVLPRLEHRPIAGIKHSDIQALVNEMAGGGSKPGTVRNTYRALVPIFKMATRDRYIASSPCIDIELPKVRHEEMHFLNAEQVNALAAELRSPFDVLVRFAAYTGLRAGEIYALRMKHIDLMHRTVHVRESVSDVSGQLFIGTPKNGRARSVALPPFLANELQEYIRQRLSHRDAFVFPGTDEKPLRHNNFYRRHFKPAVRRALPDELSTLRFHDLRHTCAAFLIDSGAHPKDICDWLGHSSITVTMDKYGHRFPERNEELAEKLQRRFEHSSNVDASHSVASLSRS